MILNPEVCCDLVLECINLSIENPAILNKYMLSGKESLAALKRKLDKVTVIRFADRLSSYSINDPSYPTYMNIKLDDEIRICTRFDRPYMGHIIRWAVSSVRRVVVDVKDDLHPDVMNTLLKKSNFGELELTRCGPKTTKSLVEARRFDFISIGPCACANLKMHIDAKELKLYNFSLRDILKAESIVNTNSLIADCIYFEEFSDSHLTVNISSNFKSLRKLELNATNVNLFLYPEKILKFLNFLNTNFVNLTAIKLSFFEYDEKVNYDWKEDNFIISPNFSDRFITYEKKIATHNLPKNVDFYISHVIKSVLPTEASRKASADYCKKVRRQLGDFDLDPEFCGPRFYHFYKSVEISENLRLRFKFSLEY